MSQRSDLKKLAVMGIAGGLLLSAQIASGTVEAFQGINIASETILAENSCGGNGCAVPPDNGQTKKSGRVSVNSYRAKSLVNSEESPEGTGKTYQNLPNVQKSQWDQNWKNSSQNPRPTDQPQSSKGKPGSSVRPIAHNSHSESVSRNSASNYSSYNDEGDEESDDDLDEKNDSRDNNDAKAPGEPLYERYKASFPQRADKARRN